MVAKKSTRAAALEVSAEEVASAFAKFLTVFGSYQEQNGGDAVTPAKTKSASPSKSKPVADEDDDEQDTYTTEEIQAMKIVDLRAIANDLELKERKVKAGIIAELTKKGFIVDEEEDDVDDEDEDDEEIDDDEEDDDDEADEDEDDDEDEGYSREELEEMTLADLRKVAKENEITYPKGADQDTLVDLILGEDEEDEDDEDEADDAEDSDDDGEEEITEEQIRKMSLVELKALATELEVKVKVPRTANTDAKKKKAYADAILENAVDEDDE